MGAAGTYISGVSSERHHFADTVHRCRHLFLLQSEPTACGLSAGTTLCQRSIPRFSTRKFCQWSHSMPTFHSIHWTVQSVGRPPVELRLFLRLGSDPICFLAWSVTSGAKVAIATGPVTVVLSCWPSRQRYCHANNCNAPLRCVVSSGASQILEVVTIIQPSFATRPERHLRRCTSKVGSTISTMSTDLGH